ncbi:MAG: hypothetical protein HZB40_04990 [Rhodocyclales bacterium]|nr:hypothetical protein [Rhodocyclales bacterium]
MSKQASDLFIVDNIDADWKVRTYQRIVVALNKSIRVMAEIDQIIETHGGWPGAFQAAQDTTATVA